MAQDIVFRDVATLPQKVDRPAAPVRNLDIKPYRTNSLNDNDHEEATPTSLTDLDLSPVVRQAAWGLVEHHRKGHKVEIRSRGTIDHVLDDLSTQFLAFGTSRVIAHKLAQALVDEALAHANGFSSKVHQKYIAVSALVAEQFNPEMYQFETGHTEVIVIDKNHADLAGSAGQEVRLTANGTATTSNRADVDQIFASVKKWALYIVHEAPGKQELDGIEAAQEAAMAAIAAELGGMPGIEGLAAIIDQLEELGLLTPELQEMVEKLAALQNLAGGELTAEIEAQIAELSADIIDSIHQAVEQGTISPVLLKGMTDFISSVVEAYGLSDIVNVSALSEVIREVSVAQLVEKLEKIGEDLSPEERETLEQMVEALVDAQGAEIVSQLAEIQEFLQSTDLPPALLESLGADMAEVSSAVIETLLLAEKIQVLAEMGAEDLMALIEELTQSDALPPELQEIIDQLDIENLSVADIVEALSGAGDPAIAEVIEQLMIQIGDPAVQAALPPALAETVAQFVQTQESFVTAVQTGAVVKELSSALEGVEAGSPQGSEIQKAIEGLEAGTLDISSPEISSIAAEMPSMAEIVQGSSVKGFVNEGSGASGLISTPKSGSESGPEYTGSDGASPVISTGQEASILPVVQQIEALQNSVLAGGQSGAGSGASQSQSSPESKVVAESLEAVKQVLLKIEKGEPLTPQEVNTALELSDTARSKLPDGPEKSQIEAIRKKVVDKTKDIPGVDPELQKAPGPGTCGPDCPCGPIKKNFEESSGKPLPGDQPNMPIVEFKDDGPVVVTPPHTDQPIIYESKEAYYTQIEGESELSQVIINSGFEPNKAEDVFASLDESLSDNFDGCAHGEGCGCGTKPVNDDPSAAYDTSYEEADPSAYLDEQEDTSFETTEGCGKCKTCDPTTCPLFNMAANIEQATQEAVEELTQDMSFDEYKPTSLTA
ncbi:MAG: hypothetical protein MRY79_07960 [Alphaproteobacteria bacterium]|nr:hypothetical protein [Alphaproteobacteria bacterium]